MQILHKENITKVWMRWKERRKSGEEKFHILCRWWISLNFPCSLLPHVHELFHSSVSFVLCSFWLKVKGKDKTTQKKVEALPGHIQNRVDFSSKQLSALNELLWERHWIFDWLKVLPLWLHSHARSTAASASGLSWNWCEIIFEFMTKTFTQILLHMTHCDFLELPGRRPGDE